MHGTSRGQARIQELGIECHARVVEASFKGMCVVGPGMRGRREGEAATMAGST